MIFLLGVLLQRNSKGGEVIIAHKNRRTHAAITLAVIMIAASSLLAIKGTIAYFQNQSNINNFLYVKELKVDLLDLFDNNKYALPGDTLNKDVSMSNTGEVDAIVRIQLTPSWTPSTDSNGNILSNDTITVNFSNTVQTDWTFIDGWWYYNKILLPGEDTSLLVDSLYYTVVSNDTHDIDYSNSQYSLDVLAQSLQAYPEASSSTWNQVYTKNVDGSIVWLTTSTP